MGVGASRIGKESGCDHLTVAEVRGLALAELFRTAEHNKRVQPIAYSLRSYLVLTSGG
jgi:hypothetical protein